MGKKKIANPGVLYCLHEKYIIFKLYLISLQKLEK